MCTLIALHRSLPDVPLLIAANRDEFLDRPAQGPALRETANGPVLAPLDVRAGGTWLGLNRSGLFAAVTNRRCPEPDPDRRSRGLLVLDALAHATAASAAEALARLPERAYNPFNLFLADAHDAFTATYLDEVSVAALAPGVHVVGNVPPGDSAPKVVRCLRRAEAAASAGSAPEALDALATTCRDHDGKETPLSDICVHTPAYGTRSSTLLSLAEDPRESRLYYSDGPPCVSAYDDFTPLLRQLLGAGARRGARTSSDEMRMSI